MRRFLLKLSAVSAFAVCAVAVWTGLAMRNCPDVRYGKEVAEAIRLSGQSFPEATIVILGDSVGKQLLRPLVVQRAKRKDITSLTSNQAITPLGNRLLLENYLKRNPQTRHVVYVVRPTSLSNDGRRPWTFHYFIYPFCNAGLDAGISPAYRKELESRFGRLAFHSRFVRKFLYANDFFYDIYEKRIVAVPPQRSSKPVPDFCLEELSAIRNDCLSAGISFWLLPPPTKDGTQEENQLFADYLAANGFPDLAETYAAEFRYRPASDFRDGIHLLPGPQAEETERFLAHPFLNP